MLRVSALSKTYDDDLFNQVSFSMQPGEKIGLVGPNGSGKSTLLKILAGIVEADSGTIQLSSSDKISYLPQQIETEELSALSSGQKTRLVLDRLFKKQATILLLDEPTNNLDPQALEWLETLLASHSCSCLIVSHDRRFLDRITTRTLEIDILKKTINDYSGNYSWYQQRKQQEITRQWRQYNEQQQRIGALRQDIHATKQQALATENTTVNDYLRGRAKKVAAKAKARESRLEKMISAEKKIEKPRYLESIRLELSGHDMRGRKLIQLENTNVSFGDDLILDSINCHLAGNEKIVIRGQNGAGKTTLLKLLYGEIQPSAGNIFRRTNLKIGYLPQEQQALEEEISILNYFLNSSNMYQPTSVARTFLHRFQFSGDEVFKSVNALSRGQRTKLALACFMAAKSELLLLDEPTNHLDVDTMECLEEALLTYQGALVVVSHDRYFIDKIQPELVWSLERGKLVVQD